MAWTTPRTWTPGELVLATSAGGSGMNEQVRDNLNYLYSNDPWTPGDFCWVYRSTNQAMASGSWVPIQWDSEWIDSNGMHSTVSNTDRITIQTTGIYIATFAVMHETTATAVYPHWCIFLNGTAMPYLERYDNRGDTYGRGIDVTFAPRSLTAGDYLTANCYHTYGSNRNFLGGSLTYGSFAVLQVA